MAASAVVARLKYLDEASRMLVVQSPAVSSHLQASKRSVAEDFDIPAQREYSGRICSACGRHLIPGWSCTVLPTKGQKRTRKDRLARLPFKSLRMRCSRCGTDTVIETEKPITAAANERLPQQTRPEEEAAVPTVATKPMPEPSMNTTPKPSIPAPSTTSQPRKKARNKNASLQALLANKTQTKQPASGFGLDFMDLMK